MINKRLMFALIASLLSGCVYHTAQEHSSSSTTKEPPEPTTPSAGNSSPPTLPPASVQPELPQPENVPMPPKLVSFDWKSSVMPLVTQMMSAIKGENKELVFDAVKNGTNGSLNTEPASAALASILKGNNTLQLVPEDEVGRAKVALGLSQDDSLNSRTKSIGLARSLKAEYVLYTTLTGNAKAPKIAMQLLLVQSGELLWSGSGTVNVKE